MNALASETPISAQPTPDNSTILSEWNAESSITVDGVELNTKIYIPPDLRVVNGIIVSSPGYRGDGRDFVNQTEIKKIAKSWGFAVLGTQFTGYDTQYINADRGSGRALLESISNYATRSRHLELANAPLLMLGFSHGGAFSYSFALWQPSKVIAFACNKSGYATLKNTTPEARGVPGLFFYGELDDSRVYRRMNEILTVNRSLGALWALAEDWGSKHEPGSANNLILAFFAQAIRLRLPEDAAPLTGAVRLKALHEPEGFLGDNSTFTRNPAILRKFKDYRDNKDEASWLPNYPAGAAWRDCVTRDRTCPEYPPPGYGQESP